MTIAKLSPRMRNAMRDGKQLYYFADLWKTVLNDGIDSQEEFESSVSSSNMDYATSTGFARLATSDTAYGLSQTAHDTDLDVQYPKYTDVETILGVSLVYRVVQNIYGVQTFTITPGRKLSSVTVRVDGAGLAAAGHVYVRIGSGVIPVSSSLGDFLDYWNTNHVISLSADVAMAYSGDKTMSCDIDLPEGTYTALIYGTEGIAIRYKASDVYAGGTFSKLTLDASYYATANVYSDNHGWGADVHGIYLLTWNENIGDAYFAFTLSGYESVGSFTTKTMDLGKVPSQSGTFQIACDEPAGVSLVITLYGSTTGAFAGEETTYAGVADGWTAPAGVRYWRCRAELYANADADQTPLIDMIELYYPDARARFRQKGVAFRHITSAILKDFEPLLVPGSFSPSEIKPIERVASLGSFPIELASTDMEQIQRIVSDSPLKNFRAALYLGADVPGFSEEDLFRVCIGVVDSADVTPKYRGAEYRLSLKIKNPITDLKRKVPVSEVTGLLVTEEIAISEDCHAVDAAVRLMRQYGRLPARYIDFSSFNQGKLTAGSGSPAPESHIIKRSNTAATYSNGTAAPDTRIVSPEEITKLLAPLMVIADGYIAVNESSQIMYVQHNAAAQHEATWADESIRRAALSGKPSRVDYSLLWSGADAYIESVEKIGLGYGDLLFNVTYCGCEWNGDGDDWEDFMRVYCNVDADSTDKWAPGRSVYLSVMEANMIEVSKWLGPESGYNGETLSQAIAARLTARYANPPVMMEGVVLPVSQYERGLGSIVRVWSKEFCKFGRRGIALSESLKFMVVKQVYDQKKNRVKFDLMELT